MELLEKLAKTISTIAILWPVKAIFEKRPLRWEVDSFVSPDSCESPDSREACQGSRTEPLVLRIALRGLKLANRRFEAIARIARML